MTDVALLVIYSPCGPTLSVPRGSVTVMTITYAPPLRAVRAAPSSLRPAAGLSPDHVRSLIDILERDRG